jgi:hypothetical protein
MRKTVTIQTMVKVCSACKGAGYYETKLYRRFECIADTHTIPCGYCEGKGYRDTEEERNRHGGVGRCIGTLPDPVRGWSPILSNARQAMLERLTGQSID